MVTVLVKAALKHRQKEAKSRMWKSSRSWILGGRVEERGGRGDKCIAVGRKTRLGSSLPRFIDIVP